jgi:4-hydroxy-tetrahydrodipicolinate synthase
METMRTMKITGSIPALVTPFINDCFDVGTLSTLIDWHVKNGSSGLVLCGTTGESPTLTREERVAVIREAVRLAKGRIPIIAGAGSNSTAEALALTMDAENAGADALLHVTGYYNNPTQQQVIEHFRRLDQKTRLPILVYNIPSRTGQELTVDTIIELSTLEHVSGVKDSTGDVGRVTLERLRISKPFAFLSGDDGTALGYIAHGGAGCISVTANVAPSLCAKLCAAAQAGRMAEARALNDQLMPLHKALFLEPSPGGVKYAMSKLGLCRNELRPPLGEISAQAKAGIDAAMASAGLTG